MRTSSVAEGILADLAAARARKLRRVTIALSVVYFVAMTGTFLLMVLVDPPRQWAKVTAFQTGCLFAMALCLVPGVMAVILGLAGVARKATRRAMCLPLAIAIVLFFLPGLVGYAWQMLFLAE